VSDSGRAPLVLVLVGSKSDEPKMAPALEALDRAGVPYEFVVSSAHRDPDRTAELARTARSRGFRVIIAGAGLSAALPGAVSALTDLPVIGVPFASGPLNGLDALFAIAQLPSGVPVGTVGIDNAKNAAALAIRILNVSS
jgi:5-(carboxyamino)imidazole ribonucleotide mutase